MDKKKWIKWIEIIVSAALLLLIVYGIYLGYGVSEDLFYDYVQEDGFVENMTALFLFFSSLVCLYRVLEYRKERKPLWLFTFGMLAVLFFFAAGEEISWGQRIFGIESSDFFLENNKQAETNLHNLIVGGKNLNKLIFAAPMFVILTVYFLLFRILAARWTWFRNLVSRFRVPMPRNLHIWVIVISTLMVLSINLVKESELHELSFAMVFSLIFLNPVYAEQD
ncbi:MAG: hypothetical protein AB7D05_08705 [Mangrovibacterium sp.]